MTGRLGLLGRLRPRFTLAALLVLITVVAIPLGYVAQRRAFNARRKEAYEVFLANGRIFGNSSDFATPSRFEVWWYKLLNETPQVTELNFTFSYNFSGAIPVTFSIDEIQRLALFPELQCVRIRHVDLAMSDEGLSALGSLPHLKQLELSGLTHVTGEFLKHLEGNGELTEISFGNLESLNGEQLNRLQKLPAIRSLELSHCSTLNDNTLRGVSLPSSVRCLILAGSPIGDETLSRWFIRTKLSTLELDANITSGISPALSHQTDLESLHITNAPLRDNDLAFLENCSKLGQLDLTGLPIEGKFLRHLRGATNLSQLRLRSTLLTDENAADIRQLCKLQSLDLRATPLSGEFLTGNSIWPAIEEINLAGTQFSEQGKASLAKLSGPTFVYLPSNWTWHDFQLARNGKPDFRWSISELHPRRSPEEERTWASTYNPNTSLDAISRCPSDLIAPVKRLHDLAIADADELDHRHRRR